MVIRNGLPLTENDLNEILKAVLQGHLNYKYTWVVLNKTISSGRVFDWENNWFLGFISGNTRVFADVLYEGISFSCSNTGFVGGLGMPYTTEEIGNDDNPYYCDIGVDAYSRRIGLKGGESYVQVFSDGNTYSLGSSGTSGRKLLKEYSFSESSVRKIKFDWFNNGDLYDASLFVYAVIDDRLVHIASQYMSTQSSGTKEIVLPSAVNISKVQVRITRRHSDDPCGLRNFYVYRDSYSSSGTATTESIMTTQSDIKGVFVYANAKTPLDSNISVDVSIDGGTTWITDNVLNSWIDTSGYSGTDLRLRFVFMPSSDGTRSPELIDYAVLVIT